MIEAYVLADFVTSGGVVNPASLQAEIVANPAIPIQVLGVTVIGTAVSIEFQAALDSGQKAALDAVVAAHTGQATVGLAADGSTLVTLSSVAGGTLGDFHFEPWTPTVVGSSWVSAYLNDSGGILYDSVWQINSNDLSVRIAVNGNVVLEANIDDLDQGLKLNSGANVLCWPWICEYSTKRWRFYPPNPIQFMTFEVLFQKTQGNDKKIERGITLWKEKLT